MSLVVGLFMMTGIVAAGAEQQDWCTTLQRWEAKGFGGSAVAANDTDVIEQVERMNSDFADYRIHFVYTWEYVNSIAVPVQRQRHADEADARCQPGNPVQRLRHGSQRRLRHDRVGLGRADRAGRDRHRLRRTPATPVDYDCAYPGTSDPCLRAPWAPTLPASYMSYGNSCWNRFTVHQASRMHCWFEAVLSGWDADPPPPAPAD